MTRMTVRAALLAALMIVLAACGGGDDGDTAAPEEDVAAATDTGDTEAGTQDVSTEGMRVAYASDLDPNDMADQLGIAAAGAEVTTLTEDSAVVAGLNQGEFEIGNIDVTAAIKAIQGGVPLKIVYVSQNTPEFVMVSQPEITEFSQLAGTTVAYHSPGSLTEIVQRELIRQSDPALEDQIEWTVLPESPNRAAAMLAGRIDATSLEYLDVLALQDEGEFNVLGSWGDLEGPSGDALSTAWVVSEAYLESDRDQVQALLEHLQAGYETFYADRQAWLDIATEQLPDLDPADMEAAYDYYAEVEMYPTGEEPPITEERWAGLDGFFRQIGEYEQEAPIDMVDLDMVRTVSGA